MATVIKLIGWNVSILLRHKCDSNRWLFSAPSLHHSPSAWGLWWYMWPGTRSCLETQRMEETEEISQRASKKGIIGAPSRCNFACHYGNLSFCWNPHPFTHPRKHTHTTSEERSGDIPALLLPFLTSWLHSKRGVETLPSVGLVMSSKDFVVLTRLDRSVQLCRRSGEKPCAPLSKPSQLTNQQPQCTERNEWTAHRTPTCFVFANNL